jgi:hypothetical protein
MFSTRSTSQEPTTSGSVNDNSTGLNDPVAIPPSETDGVPVPTEPDVPPDCSVTYVKMQLQVVPELDLTICKPKIRVTNKAICALNCECEGCV